MLDLTFDFYGRARANDDLKTLQQQTQLAIFGQFLGLPACVVSGCEVIANGTDFDVAHGLVFVEGGIHRFDGVAAVSLPLELYLGAAVGSSPRPYYLSATTKDCMSERKVASRAVGGAGEAVVVMPEGVLRFEKAREALLREVGDLQFSTRIVATDYDNGKGKYGTKAYGWQLSGTGTAADIRGRFPVAADTRTSKYAIGATGGAENVTLALTNVPAHSHGMDVAGAHTHTYDDQSNRTSNIVDAGDDTRYIERQNQTKSTSSAGNHTHVIRSTGGNATGGTDAFETLPPFFSCMTREWVGLL